MFLQENDLVALLSPAGFLSDNSVVKNAQEILKKWHLNSYVGNSALLQNGHFAGTDAQRLSDLQQAMDKPQVKAIWALRGGYGSVRIVDDLDFTQIKKHPKLLIGFSDITVLHNKWHNQGLLSLHALMPVQLKDKIEKNVIKQTKNALFGRPISYSFPVDKYNKNTRDTQAQIVGGNLANLYSLLGTNLDIDTNNKILFIEDVGEQLYQIDRMMIGIKKAGKLANLKALLVGQFTDIPQNKPDFGKTYQEIIVEHTAQYNYPVIFNVPVGHISQNYPLLFGENLHIEANTTTNTIRLTQNL